MFEAVVGLSGVQACFSPSLIHCHETVWRQARGSCRLIHWEFDQKPRTTSVKTGWQIAAVPYQINLVSSDVVKWNYNKHWGMFFFFFSQAKLSPLWLFVPLKVNSGNWLWYFFSDYINSINITACSELDPRSCSVGCSSLLCPFIFLGF